MLHFISDSSESSVRAVLTEAKAHQAAGIIWAVHEFGQNRAWLQRVPLEQYPPLVFLHMHPTAGLTVVAIDNRAGAKMAVEHLIAQGCRTIGLIAGPLDWWEVQERIAGWREALAQAGLNPSDELMVAGDWLSDSGKLGMRVLLERCPGLDGIFVCNDTMALGALHTAHTWGIPVPDRLRVVGFDNIPEADSFWPPLTSVKQGLRQLGAVAVLQLHQLIEAQENAETPFQPTQTVLRPELVVRASSLRNAQF
ncbi:LacI family transcriptional regulator [candidate division KSB1 bacterium]|nr:LacI family transcriptional regulator [candidate division KSB1 bacterium]